MAQPYGDLDTKAEQAVQQSIIDAATGIDDGQVFISFQPQDEAMGTHSVVIQCQGGTEDGIGSGNERLIVLVKVMSNADKEDDDGADPFADHKSYAAKVWDVLRDDALAATLTAAVSDFTVFDSIVRRRIGSAVDNRKFVSAMSIEFSAAPSDIV